MEKGELPKLSTMPKRVLISFIIAAVAIATLPYCLTQFHLIELNISDNDQIGGAIGGIMGPFVALIAAALTFIAFWVQYEANAQQRRDIRFERIESRFTELIRFHQINVESIYVQPFKQFRERRGREVFGFFSEDFRACFQIVEYQNREFELELSELKQADLAYKLFFQGLSFVESNRDVVFGGEDPDKINRIIAQFKFVAGESTQGRNNVRLRNRDDQPGNYQVTTLFPFCSGYSSYLGHLYRNLFLAVKSIADNTILKDEEKESLLKLLRAQLSNDEQLMLYFNGLSSYGEKWRTEGFFVKYRMIHNLPIERTWLGFGKDNGLDPWKMLETELKNQNTLNDDKQVFEWYE